MAEPPLIAWSKGMHRRVKSFLSSQETRLAGDTGKQSSTLDRGSSKCFEMSHQTPHTNGLLANSKECRTLDGSADLYSHHPGYAASNYKSNTGISSYLRAGAEPNRNRALSVRSNTKSSKGKNGPGSPQSRRPFSFQSLRGHMQPEISRRMARIIKSMNDLVGAHENASKARTAVATEIVEWGQQTQDEAMADISDKIGVIWVGLGEQEVDYAHEVDDARSILKTVRNTERSVQPSRDGKARIADQIQKLKIKEPQSTKLVVLEQELVRAEAENLVAEAQLSNVSRQKFKEAYAAEFEAIIARAERQLLLAKHGQRLLALLDDSPMTPGDGRREYTQASDARQIINDAEDDLRDYELDREAERQGHGPRAASPESSVVSSGLATSAQPEAMEETHHIAGSDTTEHGSHPIPQEPASAGVAS